MNNLLHIAAKELRIFAADRSGAVLTVLIPVLLAALTGLLFGPSKDKVLDILVVHAGGPKATALVAKLGQREGVKLEITTEADAVDRVARGKAGIALVVPADLETALTPEALLNGKRTAIKMLRDPSRAMETQFTQGILFQIVMEELALSMMDPKALQGLLKAQRERMGPAGLIWTPFLDSADALVGKLEAADGKPTEKKGEFPLPVTLDVQDAGGGEQPGYHSYAHTFAGMLCMFLLFMAQGQAKRLVEERQEGTLLRLRMTPVPPWQVLVGMALSTAAIALLISAAVYLAGMLVFGIPIRGPIVGFLLVILGQAAAVGGFALFLAGVGKTTKQIENLGTFAILVMSFAGGAWVPSFLMPSWLSSVGLALPTRWATDGLAAMTWRGLGLLDGLVPAAVLLGFGGVAGLIGVRRFRW